MHITDHHARAGDLAPSSRAPSSRAPSRGGADIVVRSPRWYVPEDLADVFDGDLSDACSRVAFSLILPHLEPYLIRTFRMLSGFVTDEGLRAEMEAFCGQEARHHRGHAVFNRAIRRALGPETGARLAEVERALGDDYRRFTATRSPRFHAAFAEGFEAMTCAMGMAGLESGRRPTGDGPWNRLWTWHLAEELEHRTVAFDVYAAVGGGTGVGGGSRFGASYRYRVVVGTFAQAHFLRTLDRLYRILMRHHGHRVVAPHVPPLLRQGWRRYLLSFTPGYDPARIEPPARLQALLDDLEV